MELNRARSKISSLIFKRSTWKKALREFFMNSRGCFLLLLDFSHWLKSSFIDSSQATYNEKHKITKSEQVDKWRIDHTQCQSKYSFRKIFCPSRPKRLRQDHPSSS